MEGKRQPYHINGAAYLVEHLVTQLFRRFKVNRYFVDLNRTHNSHPLAHAALGDFHVTASRDGLVRGKRNLLIYVLHT